MTTSRCKPGLLFSNRWSFPGKQGATAALQRQAGRNETNQCFSSTGSLPPPQPLRLGFTKIAAELQALGEGATHQTNYIFSPPLLKGCSDQGVVESLDGFMTLGPSTSEVGVLSKASLHWDSLNQGPMHFFSKRPPGRCFRHCERLLVCHNYSILSLQLQSSQRQHSNQRAWLCSNNILFTRIDGDQNRPEVRSVLTLADSRQL